jgi:hypothetical protein
MFFTFQFNQFIIYILHSYYSYFGYKYGVVKMKMKIFQAFDIT